MTKKIDESKAVDIWNNVLKASLSLPGSRIDRSTFLKNQLQSKHEENIVNIVITSSPSKAGIPIEELDKIADSVIKHHTTKATTLSTLAGLPGGWWIAGTIPADLIQYYQNVIQMAQKLAYIYGWPSLFDENDSVDDETVNRINILIGVMYTVAAAKTAVSELAKRVSIQASARLPKMALTKYGLYNMTKQISKWIGIKLTKETFAKGVGKAIPIIGGIISGTFTLFTIRPMGKNLKNYLRTLPLSQAGKLETEETAE